MNHDTTQKWIQEVAVGRVGVLTKSEPWSRWSSWDKTSSAVVRPIHRDLWFVVEGMTANCVGDAIMRLTPHVA